MGRDAAPAGVSPSMRPNDEGFTLIEVIVAFGIFLAMVAASLVLLGSAQRSTRDNSYRTTAINLAARELSITSDTFNSQLRGPDQVQISRVDNPDPLAGGTAGQPLVIDNVAYTVTRTAQWASVGSSAASTCDEGTTSELAYLKVRVEVTWRGAEDRPVEMNTVLTPLKGTYSENDGHIGLKVIDATGSPRVDQLVTITGPSGTETAKTADDGCVLFAFLTPGAYTVTLNNTGYVDVKGLNPSSSVVNVNAGELYRGTLSYDRAATITATFVSDNFPNYGLPSGVGSIPVTLANSALLPAGSKTVTGSGSSRSLGSLWPFPSGYQLWAGGCVDNDPLYRATPRDLPVAVTPGGTSTGNVTLGPIEVKNRAATGTKTMIAYHAVDTSCPKIATLTAKDSAGVNTTFDYGAAITLGTSVTAAGLKTSLPYGRWRIYDGTFLAAAVTITKGSSAVSVTP